MRVAAVENGVTVISGWSQRNLERGKTVKLLSAFSQSEQLRGVVREIQVESNKKKQFLEVWKSQQLFKVFDLAALEVHGDKKLPKTEPFYKPKPQENKEDGHGNGKVLKGEEYVFRPDWGEQLVGKHQSVIMVCDVKSEAIKELEGVPGHLTPGQVIWAPDGKGVVGVVWETEPRRLGLVYCTNRRGVGGGTFYGLYCADLPKRCWSEDSSRLLLSTPQRCEVKSYIISIDDCSVTEIGCAEGSQSVLDVSNDIVVCSRSSMKEPSRLILGRLPPKGSEGTITWTCVTNWQTDPKLDSLVCHYMTLTQEDEVDVPVSCKTYSAIYFGPESAPDREVPLIVWPHGGPHSAFANSFHMYHAFFGLLGKNLFKAVVARNPVIDIAAMASLTDIPDWYVIYSHLCCMKTIILSDRFRKLLTGKYLIHLFLDLYTNNRVGYNVIVIAILYCSSIY
ncbi:hypothetical protein C0J52_25569 [Blattella germanica]|nr:hypothetical protein C0J52_25569 [Blattella germanica]